MRAAAAAGGRHQTRHKLFTRDFAIVWDFAIVCFPFAVKRDVDMFAVMHFVYAAVLEVRVVYFDELEFAGGCLVGATWQSPALYHQTHRSAEAAV